MKAYVRKRRGEWTVRLPLENGTFEEWSGDYSWNEAITAAWELLEREAMWGRDPQLLATLRESWNSPALMDQFSGEKP